MILSAKRLKWLVLLFVLAPGLVLAGGFGLVESEKPLICLKDLKDLGPHELEQLFALVETCEVPVGTGKGRVLHLCDTKMPRMKARMANSVWKGKQFACDGSFINRWVGRIRCLDSEAVIGPSWYDGNPCIVMEYPEGTPLFENMRDEIREISPGLYIGRFYEKCPEPKFRGYFALEFVCKK